MAVQRQSSPGNYTAALVATAVLMPMFALIANIALYFLHANVIIWPTTGGVTERTRNSVNILVAVLVGVAIWCIVAWWYRRFTTVRAANGAVYGELCELLSDVQARLPDAPSYAAAPTTVGIAYRQAIAHRDEIVAQLNVHGGALRWVTGTGYINLWKSLHRLQEALIVFDTQEEVIAAALQDEWRLKGSAIEGVDDLLGTLRYALTGLGVPPMMGMVVPMPPPSPEQARALLSKVRSVIDEFRDTRREGLVRARNRLMATGFYAGLATNTMLALVILSVSDATGQMPLITAGILFFIGAIIGLFNRLYLDGQTETGVEDYGLSTARLIETPLLSGLAAVGGVLVSVLLPGLLDGNVPMPKPLPSPTVIASPAAIAPSAQLTLGTLSAIPISAQEVLPPCGPQRARSVTLGDIFDVQQYPFEVVLAAVFALTPGLLISRLQRQSEKYKADLMSTQASQTTGAH